MTEIPFELRTQPKIPRVLAPLNARAYKGLVFFNPGGGLDGKRGGYEKIWNFRAGYENFGKFREGCENSSIT